MSPMKCDQKLVMSPSRAGSSHGSSWRIFSSARLVTFSLQLRIENWLKNELKFQFSVEDLFSIIELTKLCIWIKLFTYKNTFCATNVQINDHEIDWNHDTGLLIIKTWGKNELNKICDFFIVGIVSSVSARKLKCPSSARLRTFIARLEPENSSSGSSLYR